MKVFPEYFTAQKVTKEYTDVLPMVHVRYAVNDRALVRGAYTESIARADFASLVPFIATDGDDAEAGNPELESAHSKNIDLMLEYYPAGLGIFSFGYFSKSIDNYIYTSALQDVSVRGSRVYDEVVMPVNGDNATLSGWEMNFVKNLDFLPGPLSNFRSILIILQLTQKLIMEINVKNQHSLGKQLVRVI